MFRLASCKVSSLALPSASSATTKATTGTTMMRLIKSNKGIHYKSPRFASAVSQDENNDDALSAEGDGRFMLILGKPGGGKGTISNKILNDFPMFKHLSTGDLLRQHVRDQTPIGLEAKKHMENGDLVPDDIMIELVLHDAFSNNDDYDGDDDSPAPQGLLLDGFPRTMEQAVALDESLQVDLVVDLNVPVDTIVERISDRWIHPASGRIYNYSYNPPKNKGKDDITNEDLIQRDDDKPATVRKRLDAYDKVTAPLIQYYSNKGILKTFTGTQSDVIYVDVQKWLREQI